MRNALKEVQMCLSVTKCLPKSSLKRCRWWNRGYCREGSARGPYYHPTDVCEQHLPGGHYLSQGCTLWHRRRCKYCGTAEGCFRQQDCQYLHIDNPDIGTDDKEVSEVWNMSPDKQLKNHQNVIVNTLELIFSIPKSISLPERAILHGILTRGYISQYTP